jgi:hypothetical protein
MIEIHFTSEKNGEYQVIIKRAFIDHRGVRVGEKTYHAWIDEVKEFSTFLKCETIHPSPIYMRRLLEQLRSDGGYLVNGAFVPLSKEDERALEERSTFGLKDVRGVVVVDTVYAVMFSVILSIWSTWLIAIPGLMLTVSILIELFRYKLDDESPGLLLILKRLDAIYKIPMIGTYILLLIAKAFLLPVLPHSMPRDADGNK